MSTTERGEEQQGQGVQSKKNNLWRLEPREMVFKYIRYLPWVIVSVLIFLLIAYIKIRYTPQIFSVQSSMLIKNEDHNEALGKDERLAELFMAQGATNLNNEIQMLKSRPVMMRVARDLHLQVQYYNKGSVRSSLLYPVTPITLDILHLQDTTHAFGYKITVIGKDNFLLNESKTPYTFGQIIESGGNRFRIVKHLDIDNRAYNSMTFEVVWQPLRDVASGLLGGLRIVQGNDQSTILTLGYEGENSDLGIDILNTLMAVYDTLGVEDKQRIANNTLRFINDRLYDLSDTLSRVQGKLSNFMVENQIFDMDAQSKAYFDKIGEDAKQKSDLEVRIGIANFLLNYVADKKNIHELVPTNLGIEEPALLQLVTEYNRLVLERENNLRTTPASNPLITGMDAALDKIRRDIYQALSNVKHAYEIADANLNKRGQEIQGHITSLPGKSMQLLNKERQQKILEELYSLLLQKRLEISLSSASAISNSRVVEPAIGSGEPISPDNKKIVIFYFLIGLLLPVGFVLVSELLQDKVAGRTDVEKFTSAPILGEIGHSDEDGSLVVTQNSRRLVSEQFRIARTNLQYMIARKEKPVIMVTSSFSGEGKSFISTNIGAVMAVSGKKTVIMEFDIRKPKIVSGLDLKRKMGITNYIIGKASFNDLPIKVEGADNLYVIPCGPIPPNPAEILLDKKLDELMTEVMENFEVVIMDTAPVGLVSDATNLASYADCTLYIVRQGHTFRKQLGLIEDLYTNKKLPGLCVLLNDVKAPGGYGGYYGGGYGYGYYGTYRYTANSGYFDESGRKKKGWKFPFNLFKR
ncbi:MAG TPA: polysaccharide biosynthesis tyrosine autokinase [Puia sp.]